VNNVVVDEHLVVFVVSLTSWYMNIFSSICCFYFFVTDMLF